MQRRSARTYEGSEGWLFVGKRRVVAATTRGVVDGVRSAPAWHSVVESTCLDEYDGVMVVRVYRAPPRLVYLWLRIDQRNYCLSLSFSLSLSSASATVCLSLFVCLSLGAPYVWTADGVADSVLAGAIAPRTGGARLRRSRAAGGGGGGVRHASLGTRGGKGRCLRGLI